MGKYILFIEIYCFIYSLFSVFSSNYKEDINENPDLVKFTFLNNGKIWCNKDGVLIQQIEDNVQNFDIDVLFKMSTNNYKGKKFRLVTNSYIDFKYDIEVVENKKVFSIDMYDGVCVVQNINYIGDINGN